MASQWLLWALGLLAATGANLFESEEPAAGTARLQSPAESCTYEDLYPRQYVCYKTASLSPETLDGDLTKAAWQEVAWTEDFIDISTATRPRFRTRAKLRWDDTHLYVAAELEEPQVWGTLREDDTVIFQDNDFEVFIDPNGTTHFYKEFEMNALNSRWTLCLNKPYGDGGAENSTRVDKEHGWSMLPGTRTAVKVLPHGAINDASRPSRAWTLEAALPLAALAFNSSPFPPRHGALWRLAFSRVEWNVEVNESTGKYEKKPKCQSCPSPGKAAEDNWVWSPQGEINMHAPERWGILQFSEEAVNTTAAARYDRWPSQAAAMAVYYAQRRYAQEHGGNFTADPQELLAYSSPPFELCKSAQVSIDITKSADARPTYRAAVHSAEGAPWTAMITYDRYLTVAQGS